MGRPSTVDMLVSQLIKKFTALVEPLEVNHSVNAIPLFYLIRTSSNHLKFSRHLTIRCRPQWPRGVRHEPSSPARTLEQWVRISLETWMSMCVYSVFVSSYV
jgi:hypothetical protein